MRWNKRERFIGRCMAAGVLLMGFLVASWEAAVIRPGMTRSEVEAALGSKGQNAHTFFFDWFPNPGMTKEQEARSFREVYRKHWRIGYKYETMWGVVIVTYHAPEREERVLAVEDRPINPWGLGLLLLFCTVSGLTAAEVTRRRRPALSPAPLPDDGFHLGQLGHRSSPRRMQYQ